MSNITHSYGNYLRSERLGNNSRRNYTSDLNFFLDWLRKRRLKLDAVSYVIVSNYIDYLIKMGLPETSVNRKISSLKSFLKFLNKTETIDISFMRKIHLIKTVTQPLSSKLETNSLTDSPKILNVSKKELSGRQLLISLFILNFILACLFGFFIFRSMDTKLNVNDVNPKQVLYGFLLSAKIENIYKNGFDNTVIKMDLMSNNKIVYSGECKLGKDIELGLDSSFKVIVGKDCNMEPITDDFINNYKNLKLKIQINDQVLLPYKEVVLSSLTSIEKSVANSLKKKNENGLITINFTTIYGDIRPGDAITKTFVEGYSAKYIQSDQTVIGFAAEGSDLVPLSNASCPTILSSFTDQIGEPVKCGLIPMIIQNRLP